MNLFERIPTELFSVLASPNRALYADALDVLWEAYRDNLKIPEHVLYSMLRSKLEQQLADATFEGEDIDEEELRDISGRARFLIRKLYSKGWFEKERSEDFDEYITVPGYSSSLLKLFHQLRDDSPIRGYSYVFSTYSTLKVADESGSIYDKMAAVYNAYDNTQALLQLLQMVYHNVKHFFQLQMKMQEVNDVLASHFDDFGQKVVEAYIRPLKIKDSVPKYRVPIQTILTNWAEDDALLAALANAALQDRRGTALADCRRDLLQKIFEVKDCYDSIESEYLDEIDRQVRRYTRATTQSFDMSAIRKVIFIENKTNYDEFVLSELRPWELVVYHGGFLSPQKCKFFRKMAAALQNQTETVFWADIDLGGFQMFERLKGIFPTLTPMRMSAEDVTTYHGTGLVRSEHYLKTVQTALACDQYPIFHMAMKKILEYGVTIEQEVFLTE